MLYFMMTSCFYKKIMFFLFWVDFFCILEVFRFFCHIFKNFEKGLVHAENQILRCRW